MNNIKKNHKGGLCGAYDDPCNQIEVTIDPSEVLDKILKGIFSPINFITKSIFTIIKFIIEYWNDLILRLSFVFEDLIFNLIFSINGYIDIFNMIVNEIKSLMSISLALLTNNPISLLSIWFTPIVQEIFDFFMDSTTLQMFTTIQFLDFSSFSSFIKSLNVFKPILQYIYAFINLLIGRTVKPNCNVNLYGTNKDKQANCHEYYVPKCRLNIRTVYNFVFYMIIILYFAGWLSFFKIFYSYESNVGIIKYLRNKYKLNN